MSQLNVVQCTTADDDDDDDDDDDNGTCHDKLEEAQADRDLGGVCLAGKARLLKYLGGVVQHAGLACDLLEEHERHADGERPQVSALEQCSIACIAQHLLQGLYGKAQQAHGQHLCISWLQI